MSKQPWKPLDLIILMLLGIVVYFISGIMLMKAFGFKDENAEISFEFLQIIFTIVSMYVGKALGDRKE